MAKGNTCIFSTFIDHCGENYAHRVQHILVSSKVLTQGFCSTNVMEKEE